MNLLNNLLLVSAKHRERRKQLKQNRTRLSRMVFAWTHDKDATDEIVKATMNKALDNIGKVKHTDKLDRWLFNTLSSCFFDWHNNQIALSEEDDAPYRETTVETSNEHNDMFASVRYAIACLPLKCRQVITLTDIENFSYADVADILGVPPGTVMHRLNSARQTLTKTLDDPQIKDDARSRLKVVK